MSVHIVKLCVGADTVEDLADWQQQQLAVARRSGARPAPACGTRMWPKRKDEVLRGGSLYWVIKGFVLVRQQIIDIAEVRDENGLRCGFYLSPELVRTQPQPRRAFQGWRYLSHEDAPRDLIGRDQGADLPDEMRLKLIELGAW